MNRNRALEMNQHFSLAPEILLQKFENSAILVDLNSEYVFQLNETCSHIVELIEEGQSMEEICTALNKEYAANTDDIEQDVKDLIIELLNRKLILERAR